MASKQKQKDAENLESIYVMFGKAILTQLGTLRASRVIPEFPYMPYMKITFEENGSCSSNLEFRYNYEWLFYKQRTYGLFLAPEETELCARKLWEAGILHHPFQSQDDGENTIENPSFDDIKGRIIEELLVSIDDFCERYNTFHPSKKQLIEQYHRFKELWTASDIRYDVTFPLVNFESDIQQESSIGSHLQLAPFSSQEKTIIWNEHASRYTMQTMPISLQKFMNVKYRLNGIHYQNKDDPFRPFDAYEAFAEMDNVLTALRLLKEGDVGVPTIFAKGHISSWTQTAYSSMLLKEHLIHKPALRYTLNEIDLPSVRTLFKALEQLNLQQQWGKPHGDLTVALRRFNQAYTRDIREDQIIDLAIALESCLLAGSTERVKKEKLSLRGAALLAKTRPPSKVKTLLRELYETRNNIVHGGMLLSEMGKDTFDFPRQCEDIVRGILKEYVIRVANKSGQTLQIINADLDRSIANGLVSRT